MEAFALRAPNRGSTSGTPEGPPGHTQEWDPGVRPEPEFGCGPNQSKNTNAERACGASRGSAQTGGSLPRPQPPKGCPGLGAERTSGPSARGGGPGLGALREPQGRGRAGPAGRGSGRTPGAPHREVGAPKAAGPGATGDHPGAASAPPPSSSASPGTLRNARLPSCGRAGLERTVPGPAGAGAPGAGPRPPCADGQLQPPPSCGLAPAHAGRGKPGAVWATGRERGAARRAPMTSPAAAREPWGVARWIA